MNNNSKQSNRLLITVLPFLLILVGCSDSESPAQQVTQVATSTESVSCTRFDENRTALFGDLHIHTSY